MTNNCNNVISLKQYGPTCWFNSILMALLYSDKSRKLLLEKSKKWDKRIKVLNTIKYILEHKYLRTDKIYKDYEYFDKIRPEYILKELYNYNKQKFIFNPNLLKTGFKSSLYIRKIYKFLGVKVLYLDLNLKTKNLFYSLSNNVKIESIKNDLIFMLHKIKKYSTIIKYFNNPDVIIINILNLENNSDENKYPPYYKINNNENNYKNYKDLEKLINLNETVTYNNNIYKQDSIILSNYNKNIGGHSIVGITCKNNKYVYNGWTRTTIDPNIKINSKMEDSKNIKIPCQLMKFSWNVKKNRDFCLNPNKCILDIMNVKDLCFSFNKGGRQLIYVNKDSKLNNNKKDCKNKIVNPLSNRCINEKKINEISNLSLSKPEKICPDNKIVNPKTGRCIKIPINKTSKKTSLNKVKKICPDDKILNPKTGRCIKMSVNKSIKNI